MSKFTASLLETTTQRRRKFWVAGLLTPPCGECPAGPGEWCDDMYLPPAEMVRIDRNPPRQIHSTRIVAAVEGRHVGRKLTIAQFADGPVAAGLIPPEPAEQR